jgi:hypothetical protein
MSIAPPPTAVAIRFPAIMHIEKMGNIMKYFISTALAVTLVVASASVTLADNPNWTVEKAAQVEQNRFANSGIGNGGEGAGDFEKPAEVGSNSNNPDLDPGNSGNQCQGGKNDENNGDSC